MRKLLKRWYVWLGLVLLLGLTGSVTLICASQNRITRATFDQIRQGMSMDQVEQILGPYTDTTGIFETEVSLWRAYADYITVTFSKGVVVNKDIHLGTVWEHIKWRCGLGDSAWLYELDL
jgi:hypothetical protein